ncbi:MAG: hypothetical protein HYT87_18135 [Nitrospirae bacterium]|nr:hypothetical protein [Nitrospirota bacterium]
MENLLTYAPFRANGPLPDAYVGRTFKNRSSFKSDGKLVVDVVDNADGGLIEAKETISGVPQQLQLRQTPPTLEEFTAGHKVIKFMSDGRVDILDSTGGLISTSTGKFFTDPSGATWMYKTIGGADKGKDAWAIKGEVPSKLEGYSLVFETNFRNPNKALDVFDGGVYVKRDFSNNGVLTIRDKPDKFSLVVLGNAFQRNRAHITGKVHVSGNLKLVGEDDVSDAGDGEEPEGDGDSGGAGKPDCPGNSCNSNAGGGGQPSDPGSQGNGKPEDPGSQGKGQGQDTPKKQAASPPEAEPFVKLDGFLFVGGQLESHVSLRINNLRMSQMGSDLIFSSLYGATVGSDVEWVATTPLQDLVGEPGVAISVYRAGSTASLTPPRSLLHPRALSDISRIRDLYRKAEFGEINPVLEELEAEGIVSLVVGNSENFPTLIEATGVPGFLVGLHDTIKEFHAEGRQDVRFVGARFVPPLFYFGEFILDGQPASNVIVHPTSPTIVVASDAMLGAILATYSEYLGDPEGTALRASEWEQLRSQLVRQASSSTLAPRRDDLWTVGQLPGGCGYLNDHKPIHYRQLDAFTFGPTGLTPHLFGASTPPSLPAPLCEGPVVSSAQPGGSTVSAPRPGPRWVFSNTFNWTPGVAQVHGAVTVMTELLEYFAEETFRPKPPAQFEPTCIPFDTGRPCTSNPGDAPADIANRLSLRTAIEDLADKRTMANGLFCFDLFWCRGAFGACSSSCRASNISWLCLDCVRRNCPQALAQCQPSVLGWAPDLSAILQQEISALGYRATIVPTSESNFDAMKNRIDAGEGPSILVASAVADAPKDVAHGQSFLQVGVMERFIGSGEDCRIKDIFSPDQEFVYLVQPDGYSVSLQRVGKDFGDYWWWNAIIVETPVEDVRSLPDADGDGYGDVTRLFDPIVDCKVRRVEVKPPEGCRKFRGNAPYSPAQSQLDCDDSNCDINPGASERCNDIDDDCDSAIDETFPDKGKGCSAGIGECKKDGVNVCNSEHTGVVCNAKPGDPTPEECDNKDNDCDGLVDDDPNNTQPWGRLLSCFDGQGTPGVGICKYGWKTQQCSAGTWVDISTGCPGQVTAQTEVCNHQDDDCDRQTDEGNEDNDPVALCALPPDCDDKNPARYPGNTEICDGLDNNCDGQVDEGISGTQCSTGYPGICSTGVVSCGWLFGYICWADVWPGSRSEGSTCADRNGQDDNCDGLVDEGTSHPEVCDDVDNDCDGCVDYEIIRVSGRRVCFNTCPSPIIDPNCVESGCFTEPDHDEYRDTCCTTALCQLAIHRQCPN